MATQTIITLEAANSFKRCSNRSISASLSVIVRDSILKFKLLLNHK